MSVPAPGAARPPSPGGAPTAAATPDLGLDRPGIARAKERNLWRDALDRLLANRLSMIGLAVVGVIYLLAIIGPYITPYDYLEQNLREIGQPPSARHWLGTDDVGRDYLSRLLYAMRTAVFVSLVVPSISTAIAIVLGALAAYRGGWIENAIMRLTDVTLTIPGLLFAVLVNASVKEPVKVIFGGLHTSTGWGIFANTIYLDYLIVFGALSLIFWPGKARLIRGQILSLREQDFVLAARSVGSGGWQIMARHLIPNALGPVIVSFTFTMSGAMTLEAALSYLGIGIQPPGASLGSMINSAMASWIRFPHLIAVPAVILGIFTLAINFVGDGLNDALNPRQGRRVRVARPGR